MNITQSQESKKPLPSMGKGIIIALIVLAIGAVVFLIKGNTPSQQQALSVMEDTRHHDAAPPLQPTNTLPVDQIEQQPDILPQLLSLTEKQVALREQQTVQQNRFQQLQEQIHQLKETIAGLTVQLTTQQSQLQLIQTARKKIVAKRPKRRLKSRLPTLTLASIDQWGESQTAVIQDGLQLITLRKGDQHRGWQLTTINSNEQQVELINARQQQLQLSLR